MRLCIHVTSEFRLLPWNLRLDRSTGDECICKRVKPTTIERTMEVLVRIYHQDPVAVGADAHENDDLREEDMRESHK